ncbi:MAG: hypothetical protein J0H68_03270 [Sphingobacteriia bacterium]|nr:hypothetical protein [Sphingobacteriia bacterium]
MTKSKKKAEKTLFRQAVESSAALVMDDVNYLKELQRKRDEKLENRPPSLYDGLLKQWRLEAKMKKRAFAIKEYIKSEAIQKEKTKERFEFINKVIDLVNKALGIKCELLGSLDKCSSIEQLSEQVLEYYYQQFQNEKFIFYCEAQDLLSQKDYNKFFLEEKHQEILATIYEFIINANNIYDHRIETLELIAKQLMKVDESLWRYNNKSEHNSVLFMALSKHIDESNLELSKEIIEFRKSIIDKLSQLYDNVRSIEDDIIDFKNLKEMVDEQKDNQIELMERFKIGVLFKEHEILEYKQQIIDYTLSVLEVRRQEIKNTSKQPFISSDERVMALKNKVKEEFENGLEEAYMSGATLSF